MLTSHVSLAMRPSQCPPCLPVQQAGPCLPRPGRGGKSHVFSSLPPLCRSLRSFSHSLPLFSTACSLFYENTRGWVGGPATGTDRAIRVRRFFSSLAAHHSPLPTVPFAFITIQTPFPRTPLFSHPSKSLGGVGAFGPESCTDL